MSVRALTWSFDLLLPDMAAKGVLNGLANHADEGGRCWPSVARLARVAGCDEKTARRALVRLVDLGLVKREPRPGKSDIFVLNMDVHPSQNRPLPESTPPSVTTPIEAQTPPNVTGHPSQRDPDPSHGGSRTFMNRQGTLITPARATSPPPLRLPDTAKWAERLDNHRPLQGKPRWTGAWGPNPESAGHNPLIPTHLYREWRARYDRDLAALSYERSHEAQHDGAVGTADAMPTDHLSRRPTNTSSTVCGSLQSPQCG